MELAGVVETGIDGRGRCWRVAVNCTGSMKSEGRRFGGRKSEGGGVDPIDRHGRQGRNPRNWRTIGTD